MKLFARLVLLAGAGLLAWRIVTLGIADHYAQAMKEGDPDAAGKALAWNARQPEAALREGLARQREDPDAGDTLLRAAYAENPADARALVAFAKRAETQGDPERAQALMEQATELEPADPSTHKSAAAFWIALGNLERAMQHWSKALEAQPSQRSDLFPIFLELAENAQVRGIFRSLAASPPAWWDGFFAEVARRALDIETVRSLYAMRRDAPATPLSTKERDAYIRRLQKDGRITEAYLVWVNGLDDAQRAHLGILNNGGFELEPTNVGFDWHVMRANDVSVATAKTHGVSGERALHILFKRREKPYFHVFQPLFLDPGTYRLTGQVRTDSLDSTGGLKWVAKCRLPDASVFGESERFLGSGDWREFSFEFEVPEACAAQEVRLVSAGKRQIEHKISGGAWFDAMAIRKVLAPAALSRNEGN